MSSGDQSKLLTSLNILITGKDRTPGKTEPKKFGLGACLVQMLAFETREKTWIHEIETLVVSDSVLWFLGYTLSTLIDFGGFIGL
jgi:hypothetical protein